MRLWFKGSSFSSTGAAGPGSEGASRAPADRHADAVHLLLALTSGEAREAGELAVHHQVAGRRRARHPSSGFSLEESSTEGRATRTPSTARPPSKAPQGKGRSILKRSRPPCLHHVDTE
ncbi:hypothetical protein PVAP13_3KG527600 [Panicum virgatum]|uniref:Uncharacterized protein n=1 Tax=Panicum virgatum TaxID=38727 RepID=A0A8T0V194_PANVG|nr:hypothetical protein PVAP13_3KG527600 [Panicum virgatum]